MGERAATTFLFTDIEGSTRLWEEAAERMQPALAEHDALARAVVAQHGGTVVKMTGDGMHAAFDDARDAVAAAVALQLGLPGIASVHGVPINVRCGLHAGTDERRDNDYFGTAVNRAARVMSVAHGGQVLVSEAVATLLADRLPPDFALQDLGAVRLRDLARPERVHQVMHPRLRADFPPLRNLVATPHNLPYRLTSFVGRERELAQARQRLSESRLVTLVGAGGIGKTRLSLELGATVLERFPDGVWLVELAALRDPALVAQTVAGVLAVHDEAGRGLQDVLARHVKDRALLLLLDNCEHLLGASADLVTLLLRAGPHVRVVATSREPLRVGGEAVCAVPALAAPEPGIELTHEALSRYAAVQLFVERAVSAAPSFALTPANAAGVAAICRRLDGIALALELAAARVRALGVTQIAARLADRFALLTSGDRTVLPRQQTLRALVDWSHELLDADERVLFRRLAVFAGTFSLAAAEAVGGDGALPVAAVLDVLARLTDKSLVARDEATERYRLLDTIQQYAEERLVAAGERAALGDRHLQWCLALLARARETWAGPQQGEWLARLDPERDNLIAAHAWAGHDPRNATAGLRLSSLARFYWMNRGLARLALTMTTEALRRQGVADVEPALRSRALFDAGQLCIYMGRYAEGRAYLDECLSLARTAGDAAMIAQVLQPLCIAALGEGDYATAARHAEESVKAAEAQGDRAELAYACNALAQVERARGALDSARTLYARTLALARELGDREATAIADLNLAAVALARQRTIEARTHLSEALAIVRETGSQPALQGLVEAAAALASTETRFELAALLLGLGDAGMERTGMCRDPVDEAALAPHVERTRAALGADACARSVAAGRALAPDEALGRIADLLGEAGAR